LFAVEVALFRLWESWGVVPDFLVGHSVGELAAAYVAGVLSLGDAARLVAARGRLMQALPVGGAMVAVRAGESVVAPFLEGRAGVVVAAVNSPSSTVISGVEGAVLEVAGRLAEAGCKTRRLTVSHAFHSPLMDGMLDEFRSIAGELEFSAPTIPIVSTLTGELASAEELSSVDYWAAHARDAVLFHQAVRTLDGEGVGTFIELGPDATLTALAQAGVEGDDKVFIPSLRNDRPEPHGAAAALATAFVHGLAVQWDALLEGGGARRVALPTYAFQRQRLWLDAPVEPSSDPAPPHEARFWEAVANEDVDELLRTLDTGTEQRESLAALLPVLASWHRRAGAAAAAAAAVAAEPAADAPAEAAYGAEELRRRLRAAPEDEAELILLDLVRVHAGAVLGHGATETIEADDLFLDIGFTSFTALEVRNLLCEATGLDLPPVVLFDHPTPRALVAFIHSELNTLTDQRSSS
ncbi:acyltransferase domain-containing protein, partial [Streptomyces sp. AK02-01A]|uniref:acyltransferase domain-containing protein n=1 Tax=Streptomyces sp. AK02-01A TaxID=3028648 RepID=UPI0029AFA9CB